MPSILSFGALYKERNLDISKLLFSTAEHKNRLGYLDTLIKLPHICLGYDYNVEIVHFLGYFDNRIWQPSGLLTWFCNKFALLCIEWNLGLFHRSGSNCFIFKDSAKFLLSIKYLKIIERIWTKLFNVLFMILNESNCYRSME